MDINNALKNFGLNAKEVEVYLSILDMGEGTISDVAKSVSIPRATVYLVLDSLQKKSLVSFYLKKKTKYFVLENPDNILNSIKRQEENFLEIIPQLKARHYSLTGKPRVKFFEGKEGIRTIFENILKEKKVFLAISSIDDLEIIMKDYFEDFIEQRAKAGLRVKLITGKTKEAIKKKSRDHEELRTTRFVSSQYIFHTANYIYGDKVAIISLKQNPIAILIEDKAVAETERMKFEIMWDNAYTK